MKPPEELPREYNAVLRAVAKELWRDADLLGLGVEGFTLSLEGFTLSLEGQPAKSIGPIRETV